MAEDLTFITSFHRDGLHLMYNIGAVRSFNPNSHHKWVLVDNSSGGDDFSKIEGEDITIYGGLNEEFLRPFFLKQVSASNGISIDFGVRKSDTRFICVMDPDFFVVYPNWIDAVIEYMKEAGVGILSAPYHPVWYEKAHRATGHFAVIDTSRVPKALIDFTPSMDDFYASNPSLPKWLGKRRHIRRFHDCGSQLEERFGDEMEYLVPLYDYRLNSRINAVDRLWDRILPKRWRMGDKNATVIEVEIKGDLGAGEVYFWRGYPFALHLRKYGNIILGKQTANLNSVKDIVAQIYHGYKNILEAK